MALIKITIARKTGQALNTEVIDPNKQADYSELARYLAQKIMNEKKEVIKNVSIKKQARIFG